MNELHSRIDKLFDMIIKYEGVTRNQAMILLAINKSDDISIQKLSFLSELRPENTSTTCKKLEQMGYLKRSRSKTDERIVNIILEEKGKEVVRKIEEKMCKLMQYTETFEESKINSILNGINNSKELLQHIIDKYQEEEIKGEEEDYARIKKYKKILYCRRYNCKSFKGNKFKF
jgi:DNA-binding MarR family transcriptional regulator